MEQQHASPLGKVVGRALKEIDATASTAPDTLVAIVKCVDVALSLVTLPFADMLSALERVCALLSSTCSTSESAAAAALAEPLGALLVLVVNDVRRQLPRQRNRKKVYASVVSKVLTDLLKIRSVLLAADISAASSATAAGNGTATTAAGTNTATRDSTRASPALLDGLLADVLMDGEHIAPYRLAVVERKWQVDSEDDAEESDAGDEDASDAEGDATMKFSLSDDEDKGDGSGAAKAGEAHEAAGGGGSATIETKTRKKEKQKKKEKAAKKKAGFSYPRQLFDVLASTADEASGKALHVSAAQALVPLVGSFLAASGKGVFGVASRQVQFTVTVEFCNVIVGAPLGTQLWEEGRINKESTEVEALSALNGLLGLLLEAEVYNETEDNAAGSEQLTWMSAVSKAVASCLIDIDSCSPSSTNATTASIAGSRSSSLRAQLFFCLTRILNINHLAVEPVLEDLWPILWDRRNLPPSSPSPAPTTADEAGIEFWQQLVSVYGRLRQIDTLLETVFAAVAKLPIDVRESTGTAGGFGQEVLYSFALCFQSLPEGQLAPVLDVILEELAEHHRHKANGCGLIKSRGLCLVLDILTAFLRHAVVTTYAAPALSARLRRTQTDILIPLLADAKSGGASDHDPKSEKGKMKRKGKHEKKPGNPGASAGGVCALLNAVITESGLQLALAWNELAFVVWRSHGQLIGQPPPTLCKAGVKFDPNESESKGGLLTGGHPTAKVLRCVFLLQLQQLCLGAAGVRAMSVQNELLSEEAASKRGSKRRRVDSSSSSGGSSGGVDEGKAAASDAAPLDEVACNLLDMVEPLLKQPDNFILEEGAGAGNTLATALWQDLLGQMSLIDAVCSPATRCKLARCFVLAASASTPGSVSAAGITLRDATIEVLSSSSVVERRHLQAEIAIVLAAESAHLASQVSWFDETQLSKECAVFLAKTTSSSGESPLRNSESRSEIDADAELGARLKLWKCICPSALSLDAMREYVKLLAIIDASAAAAVAAAARKMQKKETKKKSKKEKAPKKSANRDNVAAAAVACVVVEVLCSSRALLAGLGLATPTALLGTLGGKASSGFGNVATLSDVMLSGAITYLCGGREAEHTSTLANTCTIVETVFSQAVHESGGLAESEIEARQKVARSFDVKIAAHISSDSLKMSVDNTLTALRLGTASFAGVLGGKHALRSGHQSEAGRDQIASFISSILVRVNKLVVSMTLSGAEFHLDYAILEGFAVGLRVSRECKSVAALKECHWNATLDDLLSKVSRLLIEVQTAEGTLRYLYFIQKVVDASTKLPATRASEALVAVLFRCLWKAIETRMADVAALSKTIFAAIAKQVNAGQYKIIRDFLLSECLREADRQTNLQLDVCKVAANDGMGADADGDGSVAAEEDDGMQLSDVSRGLAALQLLAVVQTSPAARAAGSTRTRFIAMLHTMNKFTAPFQPTHAQLELAAAVLSAVHAGLTCAVAAGSSLGPREISTVLQLVGSVVNLTSAAELLKIAAEASSVQPQAQLEVVGVAANVQDQCTVGQFVAVFRPYYRILESVLRCFKPAVHSCIAAYLAVFRKLMTSFLLIDQASVAGNEEVVVEMSQNVSRILGNVSMFPGAGKHAPYIIADYIASQKVKVLSPRAKQGMQPGMFLLYDACSIHDTAMLHAGLDSSGKTLLLRLKEERENSQSYTGAS